MNNSYLPPFLKRANAFPIVVRNEFGHLSPDQLNWSPSPEVWSIGIAIEHIIHSNSTYFQQFTALRDGTHKASFWERARFMTKFFERNLLKATRPIPDRKSKSPKVFRPQLSTVDADIVDRFAEHQAILIKVIESLDPLDHSSITITSPAAKFITYSLKAGIQIIINHEERHINQARRLLTIKEFPK